MEQLCQFPSVSTIFATIFLLKISWLSVFDRYPSDLLPVQKYFLSRHCTYAQLCSIPLFYAGLEQLTKILYRNIALAKTTHQANNKLLSDIYAGQKYYAFPGLCKKENFGITRNVTSACSDHFLQDKMAEKSGLQKTKNDGISGSYYTSSLYYLTKEKIYMKKHFLSK